MTTEPTFQMPPQMSTTAVAVDDVYYFIYWLSVILFVAITGMVVYFSWKYKRRPGVKAAPTGHNIPLEVAWTIAPIFILIVLFHWGFKGYMNLAISPVDAMEVRVRGFQWGWDFEYPNGAHSPELQVPVNKPVRLVMSSSDVLHSFFVPQFRIKKDLVPGMYTTVWFEATQLGDADVFCAEYCGGRGAEGKDTGHWSMLTKVKILTQDEFDKWLEQSKGPREGESLADWGARLHSEKNCKQCHSVDGSAGAGPTWKGIWGQTGHPTSAGPVTVDENYVRESILEPQAKIVTGFPPVMPTYKGIVDDKEIDAIIAYMKTLQ
jgi:cytochrome c oxidase subunit 2